MDGYHEKKWFVYLTDHHEGPFSLSEIQGKLAEKQVSTSNYVWCEGMADWKAMTEVPEFEAILRPQTPPTMAPPPVSQMQAVQAAVQTPEPAPVAAVETAAEEVVLPVLEDKPVEAMTDSMIAPQSGVQLQPAKADFQPEAAPISGAAVAPIQEDSLSAPKPRKSRFWLYLTLLFLFAVAGTFFVSMAYMNGMIQSPVLKAAIQTVNDKTQPYLLMLADKVTFLQKWISPIPSLEDVTPEEYEDLKAAARGKVEEGGVKVGVALSQLEPVKPSFYISTNLPDGAMFDVFVEGIPDTLLNQLSYSEKAQLTTIKKIGKTQGFKYADGKMIPKGQYNIYVMESEGQPPTVAALLASATVDASRRPQNLPASLPKNRKLVIAKSWFLGGPKDDIYKSRLKEYHDKLTAKVNKEIADAKQYLQNVENQFNETIIAYNLTSKKGKVIKGKPPKINPIQKKEWAAAHAKWMAFQTQLKSRFNEWTPTVLQTEYFHGVLFQLIQQASDAVERLHGFHHSWFTGGTTGQPNSFEIQLGEAQSNAQSALVALKSRLETIEKLGSTPNGMPRRENP